MSLAIDTDGYVNLGEVCRDVLSMPSQTGAQYVNPWYATDEAKQLGARTPYLGEGLAVKGSFDDNHTLKIHEASVVPFVTRVLDYKVSNNAWPESVRLMAGARLIDAGF